MKSFGDALAAVIAISGLFAIIQWAADNGLL